MTRTVRSVFSDLRHWLVELAPLMRRATSRTERVRQLTIFAVWFLTSSLGDQWPRRHLTMRGSYGSFIVRDYSEILVILETIVNEDYDDPRMPKVADIVIDAGCNIGASTLWFAERFPSAQILAVEADPETVKIARRNLARRQNVTVIHAALSDKHGFEPLWIARDSWSSSTVAGSGAPV
jgi:tRNA/tmRNA/rRNA uracil-C5-methylase (TrmA/RlmC/RlmD family)